MTILFFDTLWYFLKQHFLQFLEEAVKTTVPYPNQLLTFMTHLSHWLLKYSMLRILECCETDWKS